MVAVPADRHEGDCALAFLQEVRADLAHHRHKSIVIGVRRLENGPVAAAHATRQLEVAGDLRVRRATHGVQPDYRCHRQGEQLAREPVERQPVVVADPLEGGFRITDYGHDSQLRGLGQSGCV